MNTHGYTFAAWICLTSTMVLMSAAQAQAQAPAQTRPASAPASATTAPPAEAAAIFASWDKDNNKTLSLDEFKIGWPKVQAAIALRDLQNTFNTRDTNKDGRLDAAEYANLDLIKQAGKSAPPLSTFDADKNQAVDFKEYVAMISALLKQQR